MPMRATYADITTLAVDALVNATSEASTMGEGGVGRCFGPRHRRPFGRVCPLASCPVARITPGFALMAQHIIHTVGPVWRGGPAGEAALLASCYRESLRLLQQVGGQSIAFPAIGAGAFGYPLAEAARLAVTRVGEEHAAYGNLEVTFACFDQRMCDLYGKELVSQGA